MKRVVLQLVLLVCFAANGQMLVPSKTEPSGLEVNGCGAKDGVKVPDAFLGCELKKACDRHDRCYGNCLPDSPMYDKDSCEYRKCKEGGSLAGTPGCSGETFKRLAAAAEKRRLTCDSNLFMDIRYENPSLPCKVVAGGYYTAVRAGGGRPFNGLEVDELIRRIEELPKGKSDAELKRLEGRGFDVKAPLKQELNLSATRLPASAQINTRDPKRPSEVLKMPFDSQEASRQIKKDLGIEPSVPSKSDLTGIPNGSGARQ